MNPEQLREIGSKFVGFFYGMYDTTDKKQELFQLYHEGAYLNFEGDVLVGRDNIMNKHMKFTAATRHAITVIDTMPTLDEGILVFVLGQIQTDDDKPMGYSHVFVLKQIGSSYFIINEVFRLALHNF